MKKATFGIVVFLVAFAVPVAVYSLISSSGDFDTREEASSGGSDVNTGKPRIVSVPMTEIRVGETYSYRVRATDDQGDELQYRASRLPAWAEWDADIATVYGVPGESDIGSHTFEIVVSDGVWVDTQTFEVDVLSDVSTEGAGVQTDYSTEGVNLSGGEDTADSEDSDDEGATSSDYNLDRYGLMSSPEVSESVDQEAEVLGTAVLPETSVFTGVIGLSIGSGIIALGFFLLVDAKTNIWGKAVSWFNYQRGKQIRMDVGGGVKVSKRKIRI